MSVIRIKNCFGADAAVKTAHDHRMRVLGIGDLLGVKRAKTFADGIAIKKIAVSGEQLAHTFIGKSNHILYCSNLAGGGKIQRKIN